jgi:hypothetical protein
MSVEPFTFYYFLMKNSSPNVNAFKAHYHDKVELLPDKIVSSKKLMEILQIETSVDFVTFHRAFMEYFKAKCSVV